MSNRFYGVSKLAATDPVYAVNRNILSHHITLTVAKNSKQNYSETLMAVLLPDPAGPVRNISNCSLPPLPFNLLIISVVSFDDWLPNR
jgi:hypothetical protein